MPLTQRESMLTQEDKLASRVRREPDGFRHSRKCRTVVLPGQTQAVLYDAPAERKHEGGKIGDVSIFCPVFLWAATAAPQAGDVRGAFIRAQRRRGTTRRTHHEKCHWSVQRETRNA
jgi:hypothetical protein